jgi:hypothetical protein
MHMPAQSFSPLGQLAPHFVPSHVAFPPFGGAHGEQDVPQVFASKLLTHAFSH